MATGPPPAPIDRQSQEKILERIARRYEQLDERLEELEARLLTVDSRPAPERAAPNKPR